MNDEGNNDWGLLWDTLHSSVWLNVIRQLTVKERFVVSLVCKSWRGHALSLAENELDINLVSSRSCREFGVWLRRHGAQLSTLNITDNFYNHVTISGSTRIRVVDRLAMLQGLHGNGRPLQLQSLSLCLNELSAADAAVLGLCNCPALTYLKLDSNGANIGMTGAQALAPLSQLQHLVVPTQSLGDQGLKIICSSMPHLQHINLHNDGHVTDDGLLALQQLSGLTSLDLQGSISITNRGMAVLAEGVPQLLELNISWCAGVDDWGLGQLCSLSGLTNLNLAATGVRLQAPSLLESLGQLRQLAVLRLDRCDLREPELQALAASLMNLKDLNLSYNHMVSFSELRVLSDLAQLTRLDVSHPQGLQHPDKHLADVFELTQLHSLSANHLLPANEHQRAAYSIVQVQAQVTGAGALGNQPPAVPFSHSINESSSPIMDAGTANISSSSSNPHYPISDIWQGLCNGLRDMSQLTELNFFGNFSEWWTTSVHHPEILPTSSSVLQQKMGALECAMVVNALGAVHPKPVMQTLQLSVAEPVKVRDHHKMRQLGLEVQRARQALLQQQQHQVYPPASGLQQQLQEHQANAAAGGVQQQQQEHQADAAAGGVQQQQLLRDVAALLAHTSWNAPTLRQPPGLHHDGLKLLRLHTVDATGMACAAQQAAGNCRGQQLSAVAGSDAAHAMGINSTVAAGTGYVGAYGQSNSMGSAQLHHQQWSKHTLPVTIHWHNDVQHHPVLQVADLTASEAAAVVKQVLPSLQLLKLTFQRHEQQTGGCVTWAA